MKARTVLWYCLLLCLLYQADASPRKRLRKNKKNHHVQDSALPSAFPDGLEKTARIVGGTTAELSDAAWFALLLIHDGTWQSAGCGGSLISGSHVLTSAHCLVNSMVDAVYVRAHRPFDFGNGDVPYHFSRIASNVSHPNFHDGSNFCDVAILTLDFPIQDFEAFSPVDLMQPDADLPIDGAHVDIYGFGQTSRQDGDIFAHELQTAQVPFMSFDSCKEHYTWQLYPDMVCGSNEQSTDAARGDSGGPMIYNGFQIGVISWGDASGAKPGVYTSTQFHFDWIQSVVCSQNNSSQICSMVSNSNTGTSSTDTFLSTGSYESNYTIEHSVAPSSAPQAGAEVNCGKLGLLGESCKKNDDCCSQICASHNGDKKDLVCHSYVFPSADTTTNDLDSKQTDFEAKDTNEKKKKSGK